MGFRAFNSDVSFSRKDRWHANLNKNRQTHLRGNKNSGWSNIVNLNQIDWQFSTNCLLNRLRIHNQFFDFSQHRLNSSGINSMNKLDVSNHASPLRMNVIFNLSSKHSVDNFNKFSCSFHMKAEFNRGEFQLLQEIFKFAISMLQQSSGGISSVHMVSNLKILQPFSSEVVQSRLEHCGYRHDNLSLHAVIVQGSLEAGLLCQFNFTQSLEGGVGKLLEFNVFLKPSRGGKLLEVHKRRLQLQEHCESSNSQSFFFRWVEHNR